MLDRLVELLGACAVEDLEYEVVSPQMIRVQDHDFDGFDEDWSETDHEYTDAEAVDAVYDFCYDECDDYENICGCAVVFYFGELTVRIDLDSADI